MTEPVGPRRVGYCTNVHAGATLEEMLANLRRFAPVIREHLGDDDPLPIGLWLSRQALDEVMCSGVDALHRELGRLDVAVFTINGFPFGNFHEPEVKHRVYTPDWSQADRLTYTIELAQVLNHLLPSGSTAGISTLPVSWSGATATDLESAAANLRSAAATLADMEAHTGTCLHLDLEPEPGCLLQRSGDVVDFFEHHLLTSAEDHVLRRHIRVCHDVCHASVMFEPQVTAIDAYDSAGIAIGKVQVSSALQADGSDPEQLEDLASFAEPRWLHQVSIRGAGGLDFHEDLPKALETHPRRDDDCWRVHFHVPVHLANLGSLSTTQVDLLAVFEALAPRGEITDWEVETYAWGALPSCYGVDDLAAGIADEIAWTRRNLDHAS